MIQAATETETEPVSRRRERVDVDEEFSRYVAGHRRMLMRTAYLLSGDHHSAEDLVQGALAKVYASWRRIRKKDAIDAYVRRVLVNEHLGLWRRAWRRLEHSTDEVPESSTPPPDVEGHDLKEQLWNVIRTLTPRQRAVIVLRYYEDLTDVETAEILGWPVGTVKSTNARSLAKLRQRLGDLEEATP